MRDFLAQTHDLLLRGGAGVMGFFHGMAAGENRSAILLAALMTADYLSGVAAAFVGKSPKSVKGWLSSDAGWRGLTRKALMVGVVCLAYVLDWFANEGNAMFATAVTWFYIGNEGLSLLENLALAGVPVPKKLSDLLEKVAREESAEGEAGTPDGLPAATDAPRKGNG